LLATGAREAVGHTWFLASARYVCKTEAGQSHTSQTEAEFLQRLPTRDGLGHAFGKIIEFLIQGVPFCSSAADFQ